MPGSPKRLICLPPFYGEAHNDIPDFRALTAQTSKKAQLAATHRESPTRKTTQTLTAIQHIYPTRTHKAATLTLVEEY